MKRENRISGYCEHNRKGLLCYGLYGRFRVYTCTKKIRGSWGYGRPLLAGFYEPCQIICRSAPKGTKYIPFDKMKKNDECLRQDAGEKEKIMEEIGRLRRGAKSNLILADEMEKELKKK